MTWATAFIILGLTINWGAVLYQWWILRQTRRLRDEAHARIIELQGIRERAMTDLWHAHSILENELHIPPDVQ